MLEILFRKIFTDCFLLIPETEDRFHCCFHLEVVSACKHLCGRRMGSVLFINHVIWWVSIITLAVRICYGKGWRWYFWWNCIQTSHCTKFMRIDKQVWCNWRTGILPWWGWVKVATKRGETNKLWSMVFSNETPFSWLILRENKWNIFSSAVKKIINEPLISKWRPKGIQQLVLNLKREKCLHVSKNTK